MAGNRRLDRDFDRLSGADRGHVAATRADLRDIAATERLFDQGLRSIAFPVQTAQVARRLVAVNEERAELTWVAARCTSLPCLAQGQKRLTAANIPVERAVTKIRSELGLPPPSTS